MALSALPHRNGTAKQSQMQMSLVPGKFMFCPKLRTSEVLVSFECVPQSLHNLLQGQLLLNPPLAHIRQGFQVFRFVLMLGTVLH